MTISVINMRNCVLPISNNDKKKNQQQKFEQSTNLEEDKHKNLPTVVRHLTI